MQPRTKSTGPISGVPMKLTPKPGSGGGMAAAQQGNPVSKFGMIGTRNMSGSNASSSTQGNPADNFGRTGMNR